jgi:hypothetical protein
VSREICWLEISLFNLQLIWGEQTMSNTSKQDLGAYKPKDLAIVLCGIPVVATFAIFVANFATSYAGI